MTIHPFETAGLGLAPFRVNGWYRDVGPHRYPGGVEVGAPGQPMGTCDYCGQGIAMRKYRFQRWQEICRRLRLHEEMR